MHTRLAALALLGVLAGGCAAQLREMQAQAWFSRACTDDLGERLDVAEAGYRASLALAPSSPAANNLAVILARRGDLDGAEQWFSRAVEIAEADVVARTNLAVILFHQGRSGAALDQFLLARRIRAQTASLIEPAGRVNWDVDRYLAATARADAIGTRYVDRLMSTTVPSPLPEGLQLARSLTALPARL
jgi:Tfp pilus assembly protein PilF